jgi:hypothetical protein
MWVPPKEMPLERRTSLDIQQTRRRDMQQGRRRHGGGFSERPDDRRSPLSGVLASTGHWSCPPPTLWCPRARELGHPSHDRASRRRCSRGTACVVARSHCIPACRTAAFGSALVVYVHRGRHGLWLRLGLLLSRTRFLTG